MANEEHLALLQQGVAVWNRWRREHPAIEPSLAVADLHGLNLSGALLARADLSGSDLSGADLYGADLSDTRLIDARLSGANLNGARLNRANLLKADLLRAKLNRADLSEANLGRANLSEAVLRQAHLNAASLRRAYLSKADLSGADLSGADLSGADLSGANLNRTTLREAGLRGTRFDAAVVRGTIFAEVDLSGATHLETVWHTGPSSIGVETLYHSHGQIPAIFLQRAGVPEGLIAYVRSRAGKPGEYQRHFILSSSQDEAFARGLYADLQSHGVRCWLAPHEKKVGDEMRPWIDVPIRLSDRLLVVLSEHSIASTWARQEVQRALEREGREGQTVLFPVRLDEAVMHTEVAWAADLRRTCPIGDFSGWKDQEAYQQAFVRLLHDLKAEGS